MSVAINQAKTALKYSEVVNLDLSNCKRKRNLVLKNCALNGCRK